MKKCFFAFEVEDIGRKKGAAGRGGNNNELLESVFVSAGPEEAGWW